MQVLELLTAGKLPIKTVGLPGIQGLTMMGTQGMGVKAPRAAAVAAMTWGLVGDEHIAKGGMFKKGTLSMMLAVGEGAKVRFVGNTESALGAAPKLHFISVPAVTASAIYDCSLFSWISVHRRRSDMSR